MSWYWTRFVNEFMDLVRNIILALTVIVGILIILITLYCGINFIDYSLNKTNCNLYVEDKLVYTGRTALVHIESIGENGSTKSVVISKDACNLFTDKKYVSDKVRLETIDE